MTDSATTDELANTRETLASRLNLPARTVAKDLQMALPDWRQPGYLDRSPGTLGSKFAKVANAAARKFPRPTFVGISRFVVADLALRLHETMAERDLPDEVLALYPVAIRRLLGYLHDVSDPQYCYPHDSFTKDLRIAAGLSVPCGAQDVDLRSVIGYRASSRFLLHRPSLRHLASVARSGQIVPWFRIHTDSRYLDEFNEPGWDACYRRIAALLRKHPEVFGMVGTSWFYDPQLEQVSPRLSYLRLRPLERGATLVRSGTSAFDIQSATAKSESRRRLYEAGKYVPVSYSVLWPREQLLAWAQTPFERPSWEQQDCVRSSASCPAAGSPGMLSRIE
jgi:hypothetical protein